MAEGGDLSSLKAGSDADFETTCAPCNEDDIRSEAFKYCIECQEYMCTTCARHHGRQKATRSHKLLDTDAVKQGCLDAINTKCRYHPDRNIEMYCQTHDMVYCTKCIAKEHRNCGGVTDIEDIQALPDQQEIQRLHDELISIQKRLADTDRKTQKNMECVEEQRGDILAKINEVEQRMVTHIRKLKQEATTTLDRDFTSIKEELKSCTALVSDMEKEMENVSRQLQIFTSMDAGQKFVHMKLIQKTVKDAMKLVEDSEANGNKRLSFAENTDLNTSVMTATSFGCVLTERKRQKSSRLLKINSEKKMNVKMQNDQNKCYISDVCQLPNGTIILADYCNKKIKRLDTNCNITDDCDLDDRPMGICCAGQNEIAVKTNNKVQFILVRISLSKVRQISVTSGAYLGMSYCEGELWISTGYGVNVYSVSGTLQKTIDKDTTGRNIFKNYSQHIALNGETVIVTDASDGAVCLGKNGEVRKELRDGRLVDTKGVCVSGDGSVFMSGYRSNNIVMFNREGKCLGELVSKDAGLLNPISLLYDNKRHCIIVTCYNSDKIIILDISD